MGGILAEAGEGSQGLCVGCGGNFSDGICVRAQDRARWPVEAWDGILLVQWLTRVV